VPQKDHMLAKRARKIKPKKIGNLPEECRENKNAPLSDLAKIRGKRSEEVHTKNTYGGVRSQTKTTGGSRGTLLSIKIRWGGGGGKK